jgi:hypothetical protein
MATPTKPSSEDRSVQTVLNAFDTRFNKRDYAAAERFRSPGHILYALRHAYISEAIERNTPLTILAKNCGTSVRIIEKTYAKILRAKEQEFVERGASSLRRQRSLVRTVPGTPTTVI